MTALRHTLAHQSRLDAEHYQNLVLLQLLVVVLAFVGMALPAS